MGVIFHATLRAECVQSIGREEEEGESKRKTRRNTSVSEVEATNEECVGNSQLLDASPESQVRDFKERWQIEKSHQKKKEGKEDLPRRTRRVVGGGEGESRWRDHDGA